MVRGHQTLRHGPGGSADPSDRRPIVLLPVIYRLWVALRAAELRLWLARTGVLRADGALRAADAQAYELGLVLAEAKAQERVLAGLATDWSKCYDRLPLGSPGTWQRPLASLIVSAAPRL